MSSTTPRVHPAAATLGWLAGLMLLAASIWRFFVHTRAGQQLEAWALEFPTPWHGSRWQQLAAQADVLTPLVSAGIGAAIVIVLLREKNWRLWAQALTVVIASNVTTQVLKNFVLTRPRLVDIAPFHNSLPSGHTTAAASLMVALLLVVAVGSVGWVGQLGGLFTAGVGIYTLWGQWHRVSDVLVAVLVVSVWACAAMLIFRLPKQAETGTNRSRRSGVLMWILIYAAALIAVGAGGFALALFLDQGQVTIAFFAGVCATIGMSVLCFSAITRLRLAYSQRQQK